MNWLSNNVDLILEIVAVLLGVLYVIFIAKNKVIGWLFGILNSIVSIFLFVIYAKLYAEAVLYIYYVFAGFYGWYHWKNQKELEVCHSYPLKKHASIFLIGTVLSIAFYLLVSNIFTSAERPLVDSFTTVFSFIATYITIKKWIENWIYWVIIDAVSVYLYFSRGLEIYAILMLAYSFIAFYGYLEWKKLKVIKHG